MGFTTIDQRDPNKNVIWKYEWPNGDRLELLNTPTDFVLIEYDADNNPIPYMVQDGYSTTSATEERYSKRQWKFHEVIRDIKEEYDLDGA